MVSICCLKSGPVSTTKCLFSICTEIDDLNRLSLLSADVQTAQLQAITGTPCDVPVPRNLTFKLPPLWLLW